MRTNQSVEWEGNSFTTVVRQHTPYVSIEYKPPHSVHTSQHDSVLTAMQLTNGSCIDVTYYTRSIIRGRVAVCKGPLANHNETVHQYSQV